MAYFRRRFRYRVRRPWRVRRMYRRRSYARRYVNASSRSSIRMKCVQTYSGSVNSGYANTLGPINRFHPYTGNYANAVVNNPLYQAYRNLYEETKLIGMKVQLSVTSVVGNATLPSLEIYTAWDRRYGYGEPLPLPDDIKSMATSNVATALNNNVAKISRSIYASDLMEKAQWHDSSPVSAADNTDQAWMSAGLNPNFFCPAFYFCFGSPSIASPGTTVAYTLSITYYVAFRNPKYGGSASAKDLPIRVVSFPDDDDDDDMGDGGAAQAYPDLPPDAPGDFPEDSSLNPSATSASDRAAGRRAQSAYEKRTGRVIVIDPTRGGKKNA